MLAMRDKEHSTKAEIYRDVRSSAGVGGQNETQALRSFADLSLEQISSKPQLKTFGFFHNQEAIEHGGDD